MENSKHLLVWISFIILKRFKDQDKHLLHDQKNDCTFLQFKLNRFFFKYIGIFCLIIFFVYRISTSVSYCQNEDFKK